MEKSFMLTAIATVEIKDLQMRVIAIKPFEYIQSNFPQLENVLSKGNYLSLKEAFEKPKSWVLIPNSENMIIGLETLQKSINDNIYELFEKNKKDWENKLSDAQTAAPSEPDSKKVKELSAKKKLKPNVLENIIKKYSLTESETYDISDTDMFTIITRLNKKELLSYIKEILLFNVIIENKNAKNINDIFLNLSLPSYYLLGTSESITFQYKDSINAIKSENFKVIRKTVNDKTVNDYVISIRDLNSAPGLLTQGEFLIMNVPIIVPPPKPNDSFSVDWSLKMFQFPAGNPLIINPEPISLPIIHKRKRFAVSSKMVSIDNNNRCRIKLQVSNLGDPLDFEIRRAIPIECTLSAVSGVEMNLEKSESSHLAILKFGHFNKDEVKEAEIIIQLKNMGEIINISRGW
jgi:hypothetical protein